MTKNERKTAKKTWTTRTSTTTAAWTFLLHFLLCRLVRCISALARPLPPLPVPRAYRPLRRCTVWFPMNLRVPLRRHHQHQHQRRRRLSGLPTPLLILSPVVCRRCRRGHIRAEAPLVVVVEMAPVWARRFDLPSVRKAILRSISSPFLTCL